MILYEGGGPGGEGTKKGGGRAELMWGMLYADEAGKVSRSQTNGTRANDDDPHNDMRPVQPDGSRGKDGDIVVPSSSGQESSRHDHHQCCAPGTQTDVDVLCTSVALYRTMLTLQLRYGDVSRPPRPGCSSKYEKKLYAGERCHST